MSAAAVSAPMEAVQREKHSVRDPLAAHVITVVTTLALAALLFSKAGRILEAVRSDYLWLLLWMAMVIVVDLFPIEVGSRRLTFDMPILLAVAFSYPPSVAALLALLGATDRREFQRETTITRAIFNRVQIAFSVFIAGHVFHLLGRGIEEFPWVLLPSTAAVLSDYAVNILLVALLLRVAEHRPWATILNSLRVGNWFYFLAIYLGYGLLAVILVRVADDAGPWAIATLLVPLVAARQALGKSREVELMAGRLRIQSTLVGKALDRLSDERRDERRLVSGELHDEILQSLLRLNLVANSLLRDYSNDPELERELHGLVAIGADAMGALRGVIRDLRRSPLGGAGISEALESLIANLRLDWGAKIEVALQPDLPVLDEAVQVTLYQVARESLMNAIKHANASLIRIRLGYKAPGTVVLTVQDDGIGFDSEKIEGNDAHFGLVLLRERVRRAGGILDIQSGSNGTRLLTSIPHRTHGEEPRP